MELKDIYELWDRFEKSSLTEMELEFQGTRMKLSQTKGAAYLSGPNIDLTAPTSQPVSTVNTLHEVSNDNQENQPSTSVDSKEIKAPLVGVFYPCPAPGEKPYVEEGASFSKGDVIGIIEAMKMMNEILAPEDGTVESLLVKEGDLVEYDQPILTYR